MYTVHKIASWGMSLYFLSKVVSVTKINTPIRLEVLNICKMSPSDCKTQYTPACTCTRYQQIPEALKRLIIMILV